MATRIHFESSNEIGVFAKLTNSYCLVAEGGSQGFNNIFESELGSYLPIISTSIAGIRVIGSMAVGNKNGLLLPSSTTDSELKDIKHLLPEEVNVRKVNERLSALGNCIVCNDSVAILHPDIENETEEAVADVLGVETFKTTIANNALVGSYCVMNNKGGLVHPMVSVDEVDELSALLQIPLCAGTINRGSDVISSGLVANDFSAFCGMETTSTEIAIVDSIFQLNDLGKNEFGDGIRMDVLESLV